MNKRSLHGLASLLGGLIVGVAHAAGGIKVHMHGDAVYAADGFLFMPAGQAPFSAIMLIPDEDGITQQVTDTAAALAEAGFMVVAVDLNRGLPPAAAQRTPQQIHEDLDSALSFVAAQNSVRPQSVGALGFGSGGGYALELASAAKVRAVAVEASPPFSALGARAAPSGTVLTISPAQAKDARHLEEVFFSKALAPVP